MAEVYDILAASLKRILEQRETLGRDDARALLDSILERMLALGDAGAQQSTTEASTALFTQQTRVASLLGALAGRGETEDELAGFVDALRARQTRIPLNTDERTRLVDTCGTGGDLSGTFNISTAAGLVAAAAGAMVAKHGNRAVTSRCGSADVLEALGIPVGLSPVAAAEALRRHGFAFLPAPAMQPAMKALMPVRRAMGVRTAFNILGPMTNPAGAEAQVLGVYADRLVPIVAKTLARLDTRHAFVVHGYSTADSEACGMDEFSVSGPSVVGEVRLGEVRFRTVTPKDFGLETAPIESLAGGDATTNAAILRSIFAGEAGPRRDVVVMNAAAVLVTSGLVQGFVDGARLAEDTIDSGRVARLVLQLGEAR
jgi:anthranilate phosphoribosyltransferase